MLRRRFFAIAACLAVLFLGATSSRIAFAQNSSAAATAASASKAIKLPPPPPQMPSLQPFSKYAPCSLAPDGMVCIPGGVAIVGSEQTRPAEHPKREVDLSTFYMDAYEVSIGAYNACVAAKACTALNTKVQIQPMSPLYPALMTWAQADKYCAHVGKRLPTEWEWEKAARGTQGDLYPWGNTEPSCQRAHYNQCINTTTTGVQTKPVGSYAPGRYSLYDMSGNGLEWTATWSSASYAACGKACQGRDPKGPTTGTSKIAKGGSWLSEASTLEGSFRFPGATTQHFAVRCASSQATLYRFPPLLLTEKRNKPPIPSEPTAEQKAIFTDITEDNIFLKQTCPKSGRSYMDCRDPNSYIKSNEPKIILWKPYIENIGGGYAGVAMEQNYSFVAAARSEWVWLFDYDPTIVNLHHIVRAMILNAADIPSFVEMFAPKAQENGVKILQSMYVGHKRLPAFIETYKITRNSLHAYYKKQAIPLKEDPTFGWLATEENYQYIRTLYQQGRMTILAGDMLQKNTLMGIGNAARKLGVPLRIYYPSNAPECWPLSEQYRSNVRNFPFDNSSIVLQTLSGYRLPKQTGYWHYNVQGGLQQQERMSEGAVSVRQLVAGFLASDQTDLSIVGLPAR